MADRIFDTFTPSAQDFDGTWHTFGVLATLDEACDLVGGSVWFPNPAPANFRWIVYRVSDEAVIAEVDLTTLPSPTLADWNDFTSADFDDPGDVALDDAETYVVAYATNGDFTFRDTGLAFPYGTGIIHGTEGRFFNGGAGATFPDSGSSGFVFPADMLVETGGGGPVAVVGTASGVASATSAVKKVGNGGGCGQGVALSTVVASKRLPASGTASAVASTRASAAKVAPVTSSAVAFAGATALARKVVAVSGRCTGAALGRRAAAQTPGTHVATTVVATLGSSLPRALLAASSTTSTLTATIGP